jgi:transmembrane sensor
MNHIDPTVDPTKFDPSATTDPVLARRQPRWSADRTEDNLARTFLRIERGRTRARVGVAAGLALGAVVVAFGVSHRQDRASVVATSTSTPTPRATERTTERTTERALPLVLADGTTVASRDATTRAVVTRTTPERIELALSGGAASFAVPPRGRREVVVTMARFEVKILAAAFTLAPVGERVNVDVAEGSVDVIWPGGHTVVPGGSSALLPLESAAAEAPEEPAAATPPRNDGDGRASRARFLMQVAKRDYAGAYRSLVKTPSVADHSPEGLMRAAEAARLSGHPAAAVPYYERVVGDFSADARAPVAAFTLGRVLLTQLDRPRAAADAFATSRRLAPVGPLANDAWAREVEAAARAGDATRAHDLAREYLAHHPDDPNAPRAAAVRRAGGLE